MQPSQNHTTSKKILIFASNNRNYCALYCTIILRCKTIFKKVVVEFAKTQEIDPSIVVIRMQKEKLITANSLNDLNKTIEFAV